MLGLTCLTLWPGMEWPWCRDLRDELCPWKSLTTSNSSPRVCIGYW